MNESSSVPTPRVSQPSNHNLDFVEILDANGIFRRVSVVIKPLSGPDPRALIGRHYLDIVHPEDRARAEELFGLAVPGRLPEPVKIRCRAIGGSWRTVLASMQSCLDAPAVHAVVLATRDVTEQCDLEASLHAAYARVTELEKQLTAAAEAERKYLAAELHDDVQQILVGLCLNMAPLRRERVDRLPAELVGGWIQIVKKAIVHLHELSVVRREPQIDDRGLPWAIRAFIEKLPLAINQNISFETDTTVVTLAPNVALACFRIVQQALGNAVQHSDARNLWVRLTSSADRLTLSIQDDGVGFDVNNARVQAVDAGSIGLSSMRERAVSAGGDFVIQSSIGQGTSIRVSVPVEVAHATGLSKARKSASRSERPQRIGGGAGTDRNG